ITYRYDALGQKLSEETEDGQKTSYLYDAKSGYKTQETDPLGNKTSYAYDADGNVKKITYPDETTEEFSYDAMDNITRFVDQAGNVQTYEFDANGNTTKLK
ncbi:TPA: RHS repeat protein, partial [Listeria monocytogenes]|nr:RHS repeat protein [Listeria monocytogenes]